MDPRKRLEDAAGILRRVHIPARRLVHNSAHYTSKSFHGRAASFGISSREPLALAFEHLPLQRRALQRQCQPALPAVDRARCLRDIVPLDQRT